jgi:hypothetical protein
MNVGTIDIDAIVRELTNVRSTDATTVFLFGRQTTLSMAR